MRKKIKEGWKQSEMSSSKISFFTNIFRVNNLIRMKGGMSRTHGRHEKYVVSNPGRKRDLGVDGRITLALILKQQFVKM
jgi:hypothetical protein